MSYTLPLQQFCQRAAMHPNQLFLHQPTGEMWRKLTWGEVNHQARCIAQGLLTQGLSRGDRVAIVSKNCAEWLIADVAIMMAGMISVPIYPTAGESTLDHVLAHSGCKAVFVGKLDDDAAVNHACYETFSIGFPYSGIQADVSWTEWLASHQPLEDINQPKPDDIMTIPYTSGSSGTPKGVVLHYSHIAAQAQTFQQYFQQSIGAEGTRILSYLPLSHITERTLVGMCAIYNRAELFFVHSLESFFDDLKYTRPTFFVSVPRLWVKFQAGILEKISDRKLQLLLKIPVIKGFLQRKIKAELGLDQVKVFASGSAPISPDTLRWFQRLNIEIAEGWGMTETCGATTFNIPFRSDKIGTIGSVMPCYEMKLAENNEILIRGDAVFEEYYRDPEKTAADFEDGWFKTGDKGNVDSDGYWQITGRAKEAFKTSKGKYVAPVPIERKLAVNTAIEQICVCGAGRKQPVALVVMNAPRSDELEKQLLDTLEATNLELESHQRLDAIFVCSQLWTTENEMLTPTLKLVREKIASHYLSLIENVSHQKIIWEADLSRHG